MVRAEGKECLGQRMEWQRGQRPEGGKGVVTVKGESIPGERNSHCQGQRGAGEDSWESLELQGDPTSPA